VSEGAGRKIREEGTEKVVKQNRVAVTFVSSIHM
jgi:hypothetical protein